MGRKSKIGLTRSSDIGGDGAILDVDTREVKVLVLVRIAVAGQLEDTEMPVSAVGRGRGRDRGDDLLEGIRTLGVPEADSVGTKVLEKSC